MLQERSRLASRVALFSVPLLLAAAAAQAQPQPTQPDGRWRGQGGAALSASSGNTESQSALINVEAARATLDDRIRLGAMFNQARNRRAGGDEVTADKWAGSGQYDYNLSPRVFSFGRLAFEGDGLVDLQLRSTAAAGLGFKLVQSETLNFEIFGGGAHTNERYDTLQTIDGRTATRFSRNSVYIGESSSHKFTSTVTAQQRLEFYPALSSGEPLLAKFSAGLGVAMSRSLALNVGLTVNHNSRPAVGVKRTDSVLFTGINVKFGAE